MRHYTYLISNLNPISIEKYYIGVRSCKCLPEDDTYMSSSKFLKEDINQNPNSFEKVIIEQWPTRQEALSHEIDLHKEYNVKTNTLFYNRANQTETSFDSHGVVSKYTHSAATRAKMAESARNRPKRKHSEETKRKIGAANKGNVMPEGFGEAVAQRLKGRVLGPRSDEVKRKISMSKTKPKA